ncbi:hypothetical protein CONCODRAFT_72915 [Conidiobolus coronatus NRRL 28638]|uniref:Uncharacterized protein n=1 Tax=Conidiobolus coronatus (strain ATCC 28846 / CBS 209.66 / NRRL 28638) TaxID=796925 RepID=A0A137NXY1_CONC2|nr:hypothetical protein CONCODRAFT_72915 [Conidiobolus coronatus NRRL 28638]|eukprot:KXN67521.1 hypothetical protein CONCODRAFT_72915 [Conidiobolus coronatus NRRL 28638]
MGDGKLVEIDEDETDGNDTGDLEKNGFAEDKDWYSYDAEPITWQEYQIQQQALEMGMSPRQLQSQLEAQSTINLYKSEASLANPYQSAISLVQQPSQIHPAHGSQVYMMNNPSMPALSGDASRHLFRSASPPENAPSYSTSNLLPMQMQSNISYQNIASVTNLDLNARAPSSAQMPQFYQQPQNLSMPHYDEYHANIAHGALSANHLPYNHGMHGSTAHLPSPLSPNMLRSRSQQGVNFNHLYPSQHHQAPRTVSHSRKSSLGTINEPQGFDRFRQISTTHKGGKKMPMNKKLESNSGLNLMRSNTTAVTRHALQSTSQINPIKLEGLKSMTEQAPELTDREKEAQDVIDNVMNDAEQIEDPDISCDEIEYNDDEE